MTIPTPATSLIGRDAEIQYARALLRRHDVRLLTVTGTGGVGKTRLAVEILRLVANEYRDGAHFLSIASIQDQALVLPAIAGALRLSNSDTPEAIGAELGERDLLVVLDNFEQVEGAAPAISALLRSAPGLQLLVTSRSLLRISGEHQLQVAPLATPSLSRTPHLKELANIPAVRLFTERASSATGTFQLTQENATSVAVACTRLDGLPLAIELAAARLRHLPLSELVARLDHPLDFLIDGPRDVPLRLRTLRDAISWSYSLLSPDEQALLRCLAVFSGGFTLDAAQRVAGHVNASDTLAGIASLIDSNLLVRMEQEPAAPRFGMLATIREFAQEQLANHGDLAAIRKQHLAFVLDLAEAANAAMEGPDHGAWAVRLRAEQENLRAAIRNALDDADGVTALRLSLELWSYWSTGDHVTEGRRWLEEAVVMAADAPKRLRWRALTNLGNLALTQFDLRAADHYYRGALDIWAGAGDPDDIATTELGLGAVARYQGRYTTSREHHERVLAVWTASGDMVGVAIAEHGLGAMLAEAGDFPGSRLHHDRAMTLRRQVGEPYGLAYTLVSFATLHRWANNYPEALTAASEALAQFNALQSNDGLLLACLQLARLAYDAGNDQEAMDLLRRSLDLLQAHMRAKAAIEALETLAAVLARRHLSVPAARFLSAAAAHRLSTSLVVPTPERAAIDLTRTALAKRLSVTDFSTAWSEGQSLTLEQAVVNALEVIDNPAQAAAGPPAHDLTRRELEVLALLAEHLSDREIADRLFLSPRTIERHVSNILLKMESPNRRLAAAQAVRERLVTASP
ncbi:MAG: tetratricopeptide repeat protein [Thermomicrobiales bacterium]|nr:tetratricopeptide repeat protein [Thermomicrobiales bacterium]